MRTSSRQDSWHCELRKQKRLASYGHRSGIAATVTVMPNAILIETLSDFSCYRAGEAESKEPSSMQSFACPELSLSVNRLG